MISAEFFGRIIGYALIIFAFYSGYRWSKKWGKQKAIEKGLCVKCKKLIKGKIASHPKEGIFCMECYNEKIKPKKKLKFRWQTIKEEREKRNK